jgi:apolipoprotein N-acyltransferase
MKLKLSHLFGLAILGGLLMGVSFPFIGGLFPLAFISFVPLLIVNFQIDQKEKRRFWPRFGLNYLYFFCYNLITTWWIYYASPEGAYMAVLANSLIMTIPFSISGFVSRQLGEGRGILTLMVLWLSFEFVHFYSELSWPWLNFGHILGDSPKLIQWYEYSGVSGGTLWILLVNIFIYLIIRNLWFRKETFKIQTPLIIFVIAAIIIPVSSSLLIYYSYEEEVDPVDMVIVQPNIDANVEKFVLPIDFQLNKMFMSASEKITTNTDMVIFPETAIPAGIDEASIEENKYVTLVDSFQRANNDVAVLIGADTYQLFREKNSVASRPISDFWLESYNTALFSSINMPLSTYHKAKLVLGGERLPFIESFPFLAEYSVELGGTSGLLGAGTEPKVFSGKGVTIAPLICYESVYGDYTSMFVRQGAEILCVITNDGWWRDTPGYKQHRMFSRIRAIENRRSIARSANTGISCFIDQKGEIIKELGWNEYGSLQTELNKNSKITFFTKYGDVIGRISCFLSIAMILFAITVRIKQTGIIPSRK